MKINKKNIIIPTLMLVAGVSLVGSISGSLAWYQYSTRATAAYVGTSVKATENLQIKIEDGDWKQDYLMADTQSAIGSNTHNGSALAPITTGATTKDAALPTFKGNPVYQYADQANWANALDTNYLQFTMYFRVLDVDGQTTASYLNKNVYLTNLTIVDVTSGLDLSDAVRVHFSSSTLTGALFAKTATSTDTHGKLDLNNDGALDKSAGYEWDTTSDIEYGGASGVQTSYAANDASFLANDTNVTLSGGQSLGTTGTTAAGLAVTVTIWLEGWQKLATGETGNAETSNSAVWSSSTYIGKQFRVGMRFAVPPVGAEASAS